MKEVYLVTGSVSKKLVLSILVTTSLFLMQFSSANELAINSKLPTLEVKSGFISGPGGVSQKITYEDKGGFGLFEGDILVDKTTLDRDQLSVMNGVVIDGFRWPNNTLHYRFDSVSAGVMTMVRSAAAYITANTNVTLVEITSGTTPYHVRVVDDQNACFSYVGKRSDAFGASQDLNVVTGCGFGSTVHEFLHALGMYHEQSREDRNSFVTIFFANIQSGRENNFLQQINGASDVASYDYGSVMHYGRFAFSSNGQPTIESIPPGATLGQRVGMSPTDIATINNIYPGGSAGPDLVVNSPSVSNSSVNTGDPFTLSMSVANQGDVSAAATTLTYYRSTNATITTADFNVGSDSIGTLGSGSSSAQNIALTAPGAIGNYYYGGCVAAVASETSTINNCSAGQLVSVSSTTLSPDGFEPDNTSGQAKVILPSSTQTHNIHIAGDQDWLKFTLPTDALSLVIETSNSIPLLADTTLTLYNSALSQIAFNDDGGTDLLSKIVGGGYPAGDYYVLVGEFASDDQIDRYAIKVSAVIADGGDILDFLPAIISAASLPGRSCSTIDPNFGALVRDCDRACIPKSASEDWIGDGFCDDGQVIYIPEYPSINLFCSTFAFDGGDCY